jgi:arylsulfatase A-like enzyme
VRFLILLGFTAGLVFEVGCRSTTAPPEASPAIFKPHRFDEEFQSSAAVPAPAASSPALMAEPVVWQHFYTARDITWLLVRGRIGSRDGDLLLKGEGATPVILAPRQPVVEWNRYEAVEIRMLAEGGNEVKIRIGDREYRQKLGPARQYHDYRFDVRIDEPGIRPLAIMPTDSLLDVVAIRWIRLAPRKADFPRAAGRRFIGKREEYRNALYVHLPSKVTVGLKVPNEGRLHFGMGIAAKNSPVTFRVAADSRELFSRTVDDAETWEDADLDLSGYGGRNVQVTFETRANNPGAVAFWANPLLTTKAPKNRPNVLIYMIDTLRADHTSLYGYQRDTTPFLKKLGAQALVFEDCQVQATWTKPSVASLLTSLYSYTHGLVQDYDTIPAGAATLAEQLRAAGYVTAGIVANPLAGVLSGLQRGFDYMSEWSVVQRFHTGADRGTDSAAVNKVLFPWLEQHRDEPFFVYAHTTDPHAPYRPPAGFEEKFANPAETPEFNRACDKLAKTAKYGGGIAIDRAGCQRSGIDPGRFIRGAIDRYDGEILHNDSSLEQLVGKLRQLGILDNTLIVVVSDHGEEFWEHGWTAHGHSLYQELTNGVFLIWGPRLVSSPRRIQEPVQLIDVMPTLLELLGLPLPDAVQGQSLAPFARGQSFRRRGLVMTSRFAHPEARTGGLIPEGRIDTVSLLEANWKLVYREQGAQVGINRIELFDRRADRADRKNVAAVHPREVDRMMAEIAGWTQSQKQIRTLLGRGGRAVPDRQTMEKLRSLGYLGGNP